MNKNIKIAKELVRIAKNLIASKLDNNLCQYRTVKDACKYIMKIADKYTHDVWENKDKSYEKLNQTKKIIDNLGMWLQKKEQHINVQSNGSWDDIYHYRYYNDEGYYFHIAVKFHVMLAGTVNDHELSYDFTVEAYDEKMFKDTIEKNLEQLSNDKILNWTKNKKESVNYINKLLNPFNNKIYDNKNHDFKELKQVNKIIENFGMKLVDSKDNYYSNGGIQKSGHAQNSTYRFMNYNGQIIEIYIHIITSYHGTIDDNKNKYELIIWAD